MKFKVMLATAAIATITSSAAMAGPYVGAEVGKHELSIEAGPLLAPEFEAFDISPSASVSATSLLFYVGADFDITDTLTVDARVGSISAVEQSVLMYTAEVNKEFGDLDVYGKYNYIDADLGVSYSVATLGARYNF